MFEIVKDTELKDTFVFKPKDGNSRQTVSPVPSTITAESPINITPKFQIGDVCWAWPSGLPIWPCIVLNDPNQQIWQKKTNKLKRQKFHVYYRVLSIKIDFSYSRLNSISTFFVLWPKI